MAAYRRPLIGLALACLALVINGSLAARLDGLHAFDGRDLLFDSDPNSRLLTLTRNHHLGIKHPNLSAYFTLPLQGLAASLSGLPFVDPPPEAILRSLGIFLVPLLSALQTGAAFGVFLRIGLAPSQAVIATLLNVLSMSQLIFGSMPESFGISGFALTLLFLWAARSLAAGRTTHLGGYVLLGVFATGVTLSNLGLFALVLLVVDLALRGSWWRSLLLSGAVSLLVFGVVGVSSLVYDNLFPSTNPRPTVEAGHPLGAATVVARVKDNVSVITEPSHGGLFAKQDAGQPSPAGAQAVFAALRQIGDGITPVALEPPAKAEGWPETTSGGFSLLDASVDTPAEIALLLGMVAVLALGALTGWGAGRLQRALCVAALGVIAFSYGLHLFFGREIFLYSQHWNFASVLLIAMLMRGEDSRTPRVVAVTCLLAVAAVNNTLRVLEILRLAPDVIS